MSILSIGANIQCDGCGKKFAIYFDRASKMPADWCLDDKVEDVIRGGNNSAGMTSVQAGHLLCEPCTRYIDGYFPEDVETADLTHDQVCDALNERAGV